MSRWLKFGWCGVHGLAFLSRVRAMYLSLYVQEVLGAGKRPVSLMEAVFGLNFKVLAFFGTLEIQSIHIVAPLDFATGRGLLGHVE